MFAQSAATVLDEAIKLAKLIFVPWKFKFSFKIFTETRIKVLGDTCLR